MLISGVEADLKRSRRRKTICIRIIDGRVVVNAPSWAALEEIQGFVDSKSSWIQRHLQKQKSQIGSIKKMLFEPGELINYLGREVILGVNSEEEPQFDFNQGQLLFPQESFSWSYEHRKLLVESWYVQRAWIHIPARVEDFSEKMRLYPSGLKIRLYKSRWGSCNHRKELQFNWLVMMAPERVIDYVIVHELAHLKYFNHSSLFWGLVEAHMPDYQESKYWLRHQSHLIW